VRALPDLTKDRRERGDVFMVEFNYG